MSSLLNCIVCGKRNIDKDIDNYINNNINYQVDNIQTTVVDNSKDPKRNSKTYRTLNVIDEFEKCKYWFFEIVKYTVNDFEGYGENKKELCEETFKFIDINTTLKYYRRYNKQFNDYNSANLIKFINNTDNEDFIQDIKISENIYRFN
jgi:hypothetical protein|uniref:Uncharacterized protein n=1 Tax=viral metagenome TaxID=1070528 RepID=A0A6C0I6J7_9ZZZZ